MLLRQGAAEKENGSNINGSEDKQSFTDSEEGIITKEPLA